MKNSTLAALVLVALAAGFGSSWYLASTRIVDLEAATFFGDQARPLPAFELTDHRGQALTPASLRGQWSLVFFGFTHCPDVCPTSMQTLREMSDAIDDPDVAGAIRVLFVSLDPARDTPAKLADYVTYFDPAFVGATAAEGELRVLTDSLGIGWETRREGEDDLDYGVDHSGAIVLVNPRAEYAGLFGAPQQAGPMARDMTRIVERWN